mgnify:CR=1 FL=1
MRTPLHTGFPRVSGDEPVSAPEITVMIAFSPRERG